MNRTLAALACSAIGFAQSGHWEGKISVPQRQLGIGVDLAKNAGGAWIGTISVLQSTSLDVPLRDIRVEGSGIRFKAYLPELASFAGALSADGATISGSATNSAGDAPFDLARKGDAQVNLPPPSSALTKDFEGTWEGTVDANGHTMRLAMRLATGPDGKATGTLIAVDQNNLEIPATTVTIDGKHLQLESRSVSGTYKGTLGPNGAIEGEWSQGPLNVPLLMKRPDAK